MCCPSHSQRNLLNTKDRQCCSLNKNLKDFWLLRAASRILRLLGPLITTQSCPHMSLGLLFPPHCVLAMFGLHKLSLLGSSAWKTPLQTPFPLPRSFLTDWLSVPNPKMAWPPLTTLLLFMVLSPHGSIFYLWSSWHLLFSIVCCFDIWGFFSSWDLVPPRVSQFPESKRFVCLWRCYSCANHHSLPLLWGCHTYLNDPVPGPSNQGQALTPFKVANLKSACPASLVPIPMLPFSQLSLPPGSLGVSPCDPIRRGRPSLATLNSKLSSQ
jgi:hypothetical protein